MLQGIGGGGMNPSPASTAGGTAKPGTLGTSSNKKPSSRTTSPSPSKKSLDTSWSQVDVSKLISDLDEDIRNSEMEKEAGGRTPVTSAVAGRTPVSSSGGGRTPMSSSRPPLPPLHGSGSANNSANNRTPQSISSGRQQTASPVSSRMPNSPVTTGSGATPRILSSSLGGPLPPSSVSSTTTSHHSSAKLNTSTTTTSSSGSNSADMDADKGLKMKIKRTKSGRQEIVKSESSGSNVNSKSSSKGLINGDTSSSESKSNSSSVAVNGQAPVGGNNMVALAAFKSSNNSGVGSSNNSSSAPVSSGSNSSTSATDSSSGPPSASSASGGSSPRSPLHGRSGSPPLSTTTPNASSAAAVAASNNPAVTTSDMNGICNNNGKTGAPVYTNSSSGGGGGGSVKAEPSDGFPTNTSYNPLSSASIQMLTSKKLKVDVGTVTDASTVTEPEMLGPCEPGTPVNLDGIVWHETDTGVLVVNVTWRGKTYVGTLLDCARHTNQWSAPRFTDSPVPGEKGRGKRSRNSATPQELEPRKNLRSSKGKGKNGKGGAKGAAAALAAASEDEFNFPAPASPKDGAGAGGGGKRKKEAGDLSGVEDSKKRKRTSSDSDDSSSQTAGGGDEDVKPPVPIKREPKPVVYSYTMFDCPRKDCNKQYKAEDGLKWHVSHSHPEYIGPDGEMRDAADVEREEQERKEEQERRRRAARQEKEERKKKEAMARQQENSDSSKGGTPAKQPKLDDAKSQPGTPVDGKMKQPSFPPVPPTTTTSTVVSGAVPSTLVLSTQTTTTNPSTQHTHHANGSVGGLSTATISTTSAPVVAAAAAGPGGAVTTTSTPTLLPPTGLVPPANPAPPWTNPATAAAAAAAAAADVQALPTDPRIFEDNLKKMKATIDSLSAIPVVSGSGPGGGGPLPGGPAAVAAAVTTSTSAAQQQSMTTPRPADKTKMRPATSPAAFSDISDDGDDSSRTKDLKLNTSLDSNSGSGGLGVVIPGLAPPPPGGRIGGPSVPGIHHPLQPVPGGLPGLPMPGIPGPGVPPHPPSAGSAGPNPPNHHAMPPRTSSPIVRPHPPPPSAAPPPSSSSTTTLPRSSVSLPGSGVPGPEPGTPEYHKYLAANGFPPFPYPYPVGMDPNYHIQLLKTDPGYKAKWEKDRAERERAFKEQLDKDQGRFSGLSLIKEDRLQASQNRNKHSENNPKPEDLRKREPSGDSRPTSRASPMISVKPEFREKEDLKKEVKNEDQGVKPTMETRGPPPGPQTFGYMHPSLVRPPYSLGGLPPPFDPMFVNSGGVSPYGLPPGLPGGIPSPYLNPGLIGSPNRPPVPFSSFGGAADPLLRAPFPLGTAEDLARAAGAPPPSLSGTKALDLLQHHASQYYANQKLAELQERALKSPISSMSAAASSVRSGSPSVSKPITTLAGTKDSLIPTSAASKSPPPLRHVHTHTHTHIGLGYPLLPGAIPNVPSGIPPVGSLPPGALPPPPVGVASAPFSSPNAYPGKSPT